MLSCSARKIPALASGVLLVIHVALLGWIASSYSPVVCELTQVPAGVSHLGLGNFDVYRVHPPLVRMLAAVPLILTGARTDWSRLDNSPDHRCEMAVGQDFLAANGEHAFDLFSLARVAAIPFSVLGALVVGRWAQELYGPRARLMAIALWCFNPTILGNGALVTADVAAGSLAIVSCYQFRKWLMRPSKSNAYLLGFVLGAAQLTKTTLILLYPVFFVLQGLAWMRRYGDARDISWTQVMLVLATSLVVLNGGYSFDGTFTTLGEYNFHSSGLRDPETTGASNRFAGSWLARIPVPLPQDYVQGIDLQEFDFEMTKRSYLAGEWKNGGWWYFYLYALLVKEPIGFLLLLTLAGFLCLWRRQSPTTEDLLLVIPAMSFLIFVSSHTGFSIHYRYIFPVIPPLIVWVSRLDRAGLSPVDWIVRVLVVWSMGSALYVFPHELSYFNEFAGGPSCGSRHLLGSSISWGQDLRYFRRWVEDKAGEEPVFLATLSYVNPKWANIDFRLAPTVNKNCNGATWAKMPTGWYAIDVN
ncbi:MAG: hypothetical protein O2931_00630, partial [Planctomycetota bacterium]|nr:hypothetical protein [Planctomycetota bacterium]